MVKNDLLKRDFFCSAPPLLAALPGNLPMVLHLLIGSLLTRAGLWMGTRILIRPDPLLHRRLYPLLSPADTLSQNNKNKSHSEQPGSTLLLSQTHCWGAADGDGVTSINANDDGWASWWNIAMSVRTWGNKRGSWVKIKIASQFSVSQPTMKTICWKSCHELRFL